jgi:rhodanese-related sulfurtransferase
MSARLRATFVAMAHAAAIAATGGAVGLAFNALRHQPLPLWGSVVDRLDSGMCEAEQGEVPQVAPGRALALLGRPGVTFVDVRDPDRYDAGHLPGAVNLPFDAAVEMVAAHNLPFPANDQVVVYCDSEACQLSTLLASMLVRADCVRVGVLEGGWPAWHAAGLPIEGAP